MLASWVLTVLFIALNLAILPYFAYMATVSLASIFAPGGAYPTRATVSACDRNSCP